MAPFIGGVDMTPLDESARWKKIAADNELFWREIDTRLTLLTLHCQHIHGVDEHCH